MELIKLIEDLIKSVVDEKDLVAVKEFETEEENVNLFQVLVSEKDMNKVIGKNGKVINAIRTLAQASSYTKDNKMIKINVDSI